MRRFAAEEQDLNEHDEDMAGTSFKSFNYYQLSKTKSVRTTPNWRVVVSERREVFKRNDPNEVTRAQSMAKRGPILLC